MALKEIIGDLLKSDVDCIVHQCNCLSTVGSGIALSIKNMYPIVYRVDCAFDKIERERLGHCSMAIVTNTFTNKPLFVGNLYGQHLYRRTRENNNLTEYTHLYSALVEFIKKVDSNFNTTFTIGVPHRMGCDRAGGDWSIVYKILRKISIEFPHVDIIIHKLESTK